MSDHVTAALWVSHFHTALWRKHLLGSTWLWGTESQHGMAPACTFLLQLLSGSQNEAKPYVPEVKNKCFDLLYQKDHQK